MSISPTTNRLRDERAAAVRRAETIDATAGDRELTDDEHTEFERCLADVRRIDRELAVDAVRTAAQVPGAVVGPNLADVHFATGISRQDPWQTLRDGAVRSADLPHIARAAIERSEGVDDASKANADRLVGLGDTAAEYLTVVSDPAYRSGFWKLAADPNRGQFLLDDAERAAVAQVTQRAASLTDAAGGYAVPFTLDPTVMLTNAGTVNPFRRLARNVSTVTDSWNGVSSAGVTASWDAEATQVSDDAPTLAQPSIPVHKAASFIPFSIEIGQDWRGLEAECAKLFADAKDRLEGAAFATGSGSGQPTGVVTALVAASTPVVASTTANAYVIGDVFSLSESVPARHWEASSWVMHRALLNDTRQFGTSVSASFTVELTEAGPPRILGRPVYESSDLDSTYGSGENYCIVLGDFSSYVVVDRIGLSVELIPHLFATQDNRPSGQRGFYAHWRVGADVVDGGAGLRVLNIT